MVQVGETLVLLFDSWRGGGTQDVLEGARRSVALSHEPRLFMLQERSQSFSGENKHTARLLIREKEENSKGTKVHEVVHMLHLSV